MSDTLKMPKAAWKATLDGKDLTDTVAPRLISLTLSEKRGDEADQLDIVLHDADGRLALPKTGVTLKISLGWKQGTGLPTGLVDKGSYKVDEASWSGPPDQVTIRARSADLTDALRVRRERSFIGKTVKHIVSAIAADNGLTPSIEAALGAKTIPALGPGAKSDAALLRALGKRFDAVATIKAGTLIFAPIGSGKTASGKQLPTETIDRSQTVKIEYQRVERDNYDGVEASWHDKTTGQRNTLNSGHTGKGKAKRLRKVYASQADAQHAADAEAKRTNRAKFRCIVELIYGRPDIFPERPVKLTGVKDEIAAHDWIVAEAEHGMDGQGGSKTRLTLEASK